MGIRLNKAVGYGLTDVAVGDGFTVVDQRVNPTSPLLTFDPDADLDSYLRWLAYQEEDPAAPQGVGLEIAALLDYNTGTTAWKYRPDSAAVHQPEYGLPNVLLLMPLYLADAWHRRDDTIDYTEEVYGRPGRDPLNPRVTVLPHGIYPYNGAYMDSRTGVRLSNNVMPWVQARAAGGVSPELLQHLAVSIVAAGGGTPFTSHADADRHVAPVVPPEICRLAAWGKLFTTPDVVLQLRPMLYVWWS